MKDKAASTLERLKNQAKELDITYQQCLQLFVQEELLRKITKSEYANNFVLKGGYFIYTLTDFKSRTTIDVDFLLRHLPTTTESVQKIIEDIIKIPTGNEYIKMTVKAFTEISEQRKYKGVSMQIIAEIKRVRIPFSVDIGVDDVIVPDVQLNKVTTQLADFESPKIQTYSLESVIAEKLDAILRRFELTSRMKDFYDIYYIAQNFDFQGFILQEALYETFCHRKTDYNNTSFLRICALVNDESIKKRWKNFLIKMPGIDIDFTVVIDGIQNFLEPIFNAIVDGKRFFMSWDKKESKWKEEDK